MPGRYLLDTNIVIALFARDRPVEEHLKQHSLILVSRDSHFGVVEGLLVETW